MCEDVKVSIYCLAYNHGKYIRNCLDGFVNQKTNFEYEVIVHDDASTDNTPDIIQEYADKYPDIIRPILQKENQYSQGVRIVDEYIIPKIRGKYIACCEGDDYWCDNEKLQKQVDILENNPQYVACVHQTKLFDCRNKKESLFSCYKQDCIVETEKVFDAGMVYHTSSLMHRSHLVYKKPSFCFVSKQVGDYPLAIFLAIQGPIYFIGDSMSVYRMYTEGSWTVRNSKAPNIDHQKDMIKILKLADEYSKFKYHELIDRKILEHEYKIWKYDLSFKLLWEKRFNLLNPSRKVKLILRVLLKCLGLK